VPKPLKKTLNDLIAQTQGWIDAEAGPGKCIVHPIFENGDAQASSVEMSDGIATRVPGMATYTARSEGHNQDDEGEPEQPTDPTKKPRAVPTNLHISLTQPLPLRKSQIPELLAHLRSCLGATGTGAGIKVGLEGGFRAYTNGAQQDGKMGQGENGENGLLDDLGRKGMGRKSRGFLALGVGVGHDEVSPPSTWTGRQL
jgi:hypothetical protein